MEKTSPPTLYLLPGHASDERLLRPQMGISAPVKILTWLEPDGNESLSHYAHRMLERVETGQPLVLGGVSLGGLVAQEMAAITRPKGIVLIGSLRSCSEIALGARMAARMPPGILRFLTPLLRISGGPVSHLLGVEQASHRRLLTAMLRKTSSGFLTWGIQALGKWEPPPLSEVPLLRIHGRRDRIIHPKGPVDIWVEGAGHVVNLTNPATVNRAVEEFLLGLEPFVSDTG